MNLGEFKQKHRTKGLVFGKPKVGKTELVGKLAKAGYILDWFDLESGIKTVIADPEVQPFLQNINYFRIPDHKMMPVAIDTIKGIFRTPGPKKICHDHGIINCMGCGKNPDAQFSIFDFKDYDGEAGAKRILVIDSLSQLAMSAMFKKILVHIKGDKGDDYKIEWDDYTAQSNALTEILSKMQVLPINCIFISHDLDVEKDEKKQMLVPQSGTRNYSALVAKFFDEIAYMHVTNGKHKVETSTTFSNTVLTGGRSKKSVVDKDGKFSLVPWFEV